MLPVFVVILFLVAATVLLALPLIFSLGSRALGGRRVVSCPETRSPVEVEVDGDQAWKTQLRGLEHLRLKNCERWPAREDCDQDCLAQIAATPEVINRILAKWYEGKGCAHCGAALGDSDWRLGRFALLDDAGNILEARDVNLQDLPQAVDGFLPLCWRCHEQAALERVPQVYLKGDRRKLRYVVWSEYDA